MSLTAAPAPAAADRARALVGPAALVTGDLLAGLASERHRELVGGRSSGRPAVAGRRVLPVALPVAAGQKPALAGPGDVVARLGHGRRGTGLRRLVWIELTIRGLAGREGVLTCCSPRRPPPVADG